MRPNSEHKEAIWSSCLMDSQDESTGLKSWSAPKRRTHPNATIACIGLNENGMPRITSIYLPTSLEKPEDFTAHPNHVPTLSTSPKALHEHPTAEDIYKFFSDPLHYFSSKQAAILSAALLARYPSSSSEYMHCNTLWSTNELLKREYMERAGLQSAPTEQEPLQNTPPRTFLTLPLPQAVPNASVQLYPTNENHPLVVKNYPISYGIVAEYEFWIRTFAKHNCIRKEVLCSKSVNPFNGKFAEPKVHSPAKHTICVMRQDTNPLSPQYGLPFADSIRLYNEEETSFSDVYAFAMRNHVNSAQRILIQEYLQPWLLKNPQELANLTQFWASYQPAPDLSNAGV